jgi:hypothetical protein
MAGYISELTARGPLRACDLARWPDHLTSPRAPRSKILVADAVSGAPVAAILLLHPAPTIQSPDPALPAAVDAVRTAVCGAAATAAALDVLASVRQELADAEAAMRDRADLRREVAALQELNTQVRPGTLLYTPPDRVGQQLVACAHMYMYVRGLIGLLVGCCQAEHRHAQAATALLATQQKLQAAELSEVRHLTSLDGRPSTAPTTSHNSPAIPRASIPYHTPPRPAFLLAQAAAIRQHQDLLEETAERGEYLRARYARQTKDIQVCAEPC